MDPSPPSLRSPFVTGLAILGICVGAFMFMSDLVSAGSTLYLTNTPEYRMAMQQLRTYQPSMESMLVDTRTMVINTLIGLALSAAAVVASVGLLRRKHWGRTSFLWITWAQVVFYVSEAVGGFLLTQSLEARTGLGQVLGSSGVWMFSAAASVAGIIIALLVAGGITWKLSQERVRREFDGGSTT
jgi:hypothetical protein